MGSIRKNRELKIYEKVEKLLDRMYPRIITFPESEKFALAQRIQNAFFDMLVAISMGNKVKSKRVEYLQMADGYLEALVSLVDFARRRRYISIKFNDSVQAQFEEIGKMLSGYIKSAAKKS